MTLLQSIWVLLFHYGLLFVTALYAWKLKSDSLTSVLINGKWELLHFRHIAGILIMLPAPFLFVHDLPFYLLLVPQDITGVQTIILAMTALSIMILGATQAEKFTINKIRMYRPGSLQIIMHFLSRSVFLVVYEMFFRGFILFVSINAFGLIPAVFINIFLYSLIHVFNKKEVIGSIPFGLLLCVFTIWFQTIWIAVVLHWLLSVSFESVVLQSQLVKNQKHLS